MKCRATDLQRYRVAGSTGSVIIATDTSNGDTVAIKVRCCDIAINFNMSPINLRTGIDVDDNAVVENRNISCKRSDNYSKEFTSLLDGTFFKSRVFSQGIENSTKSV